MKPEFNANNMWNNINDVLFKDININNFRTNGNAASRISTSYNLKTHSMLFFKTILHNMAKTLTLDEKESLNRVKNRNLGNPLTIEYETGLFVDIDYLQGIKEISFLKEILNSCSNILEIGAGYGRTVHIILSLFKNINYYTIIDLKPMLNLAREYLSSVLNFENFQKIKFLPIENINTLNDKRFDLTININSLQEMQFNTAKNYLDFIDKHCKWFYTNNTLGKFDPDLCNFEKNESSNLALASGLLRNIINIFNVDQLKKARKAYIHEMQPSSKWKTIKHADCLPWPHYYQALYANEAFE